MGRSIKSEGHRKSSVCDRRKSGRERRQGNCAQWSYTQAVKYDGDYLLEPHQREAIAHIVLEKSPLVQFRERFPFLSDADGF